MKIMHGQRSWNYVLFYSGHGLVCLDGFAEFIRPINNIARCFLLNVNLLSSS